MVMVPTTPSGGNESDDQSNSNSYCCTAESSPNSDATTNWIIAHGSLQSALTFESPDSAIDLDSTPESPLVLKPPSIDSGPCEIKICFAQRQEIQQVYVRSTARVYEIYYSSSLHGENEYLCTVRCSMAEREGEFLLVGIEDASNQHMNVNKGGPAMEKITRKGKTGSNSKDDWVDVESSDLPVLDNEINCSVKQASGEGVGIVQELYEATAQISDAEPCASITIRLLSLQNKDCLYIDEVYVFGVPNVSTDSEQHSFPVQSSAQSSLMAMLIPTLLQISKSGSSRRNENSSSDRLRKDDEVESTASRADVTDASNGIHCKQSVTIDEEHSNLCVDNQLASEPVQPLVPTTDENMVVNGEKREPPKQLAVDEKSSTPDIERVLGQLVDRVSRIEDICLRFEETMLKPINSMEARLQRVEEQLEILAKNPQYNTGMPCNRISAPSFSCSDSNFGSLYSDGNDPPPNSTSELKTDSPEDKLSSPVDNSSVSVNSPCMLPALVIAAPEFSCGEEEEEEEDNHVSEPSKDSPEVKRNKALSIDDALAAALSGFLSTSAISHAEHTQNAEVSPSEHSTEIKKDSKPLGCARCSPVPRKDCIGDESIEDTPSEYNQTVNVTASKFIPEDAFCCSENEDDQEPSSSSQYTSTDKSENCSDEVNDSAKHPSSILLSENKPGTEGSAGELAKDDDVIDILGGSQYSATSVDFEIPILDVKFGSHEDSGTTLPLEILLGNTAGTCSSSIETGADINVSDDENDDVRYFSTRSDILGDYTRSNLEGGSSDLLLDPGWFTSLI